MKKVYFRHDNIRRYQSELIEDVYDAVENGHNLLANAPVGMGKTDAAISSCIHNAMKNNLTIFFLTPKISQHRIALDVVKGISEKYYLNLKAVDMIGRRYSCIDPILSDLDSDSFYQSCEKKRRRETCAFYENAKGYNKIQQIRANSLFKKIFKEYGSTKTHDEVIKLGEKHLACPYEIMIKLASNSNIIVADYFHLMSPYIRDILLSRIKKKLEESIIIVDEAHNLAKRIRDYLSTSLNSFSLRRAEKEMKLLGMDVVPLENEFNNWAKDELKGAVEKIVSEDSFKEFVSRYNMDMDELGDYFENIGISYVERANKRSSCLKISKFIRHWGGEEKSTIRILRRKGKWYTLSKKFMDPSYATSALNQAHSAILMSGTLLPLEMHRDVLGLDPSRTVMKNYPSPFDEKNTVNMIVEGITTKYSKRDFENYKRMAEQIDSVVGNSPDGVALFFPSYVVMDSVVPLLKSKNLILQKEKMTPIEVGKLLKRFSNGGVLCAVQGGSLAEGVDYCNQEIKTAVIIGVALEEMSIEVDSLIDYYQDKFGRGWDYGYLYPAIIKGMQAAGRGIRKESDRAAIVFMDERFKWKNYKEILDGRKFIITKEPEKYVKRFWG